MVSSPNLVEAPAVTYEYLFCPPSSDWLRPPTRRRAQGLLLGSNTPRTVSRRLQLKILDMTGFLHWQTARVPYTPISYIAPPLLAEEEGPPT
jgi:hypothetical protein